MEYTQEEIDKMIQKEADTRVNQALEKRDAKHKQELEDIIKQTREETKKEIEANAKLTAEELAKKNMDEQLASIALREQDISKRTNNLTARELLNSAGIPKDVYESMIGMMVSDDDETTKTNVGNFINVYNQNKTNIENKIKEEFSKVPAPKTGGADVITKADFDKMGYAEKLKFKADNPELANTFMK